MSRLPRSLAVLVAALATAALLSACAPEGGATPSRSAEATPTATSSSTGSPTPTTSPSPSPSGTAEATPTLPTDCRAILTDPVLAELGDTPLNPENFGPTGVQADGSLICLWRYPDADTTFLQTTISKMSSGPALDMLNALVADEGFSCFTPDKGTRCEKTWQNTQYPVTDGRTLFYRSGLLIDTQFSNLAPSGYTSAIVSKLFG